MNPLGAESILVSLVVVLLMNNILSVCSGFGSTSMKKAFSTSAKIAIALTIKLLKHCPHSYFDYHCEKILVL